MNSKLDLFLGLALAVLLFSSVVVSAGELPSKTSSDPKAKTKGAEVEDKNVVKVAKYDQGSGGYPGGGYGGYPVGGDDLPPGYGGPGGRQERPPGYGGPGGGQERPPGYGGPGGQERPPGYGGPGGGGQGCIYGRCGYRCCNAAEARAQAQAQAQTQTQN